MVTQRISIYLYSEPKEKGNSSEKDTGLLREYFFHSIFTLTEPKHIYFHCLFKTQVCPFACTIHLISMTKSVFLLSQL